MNPYTGAFLGQQVREDMFMENLRDFHGRYSGKVLVQYGFGQYGLLGKGVSQGIALHEGRRFGPLNQVVNLAMVLGVLFLSVTGPVMWWQRRPKGALATAPRRPKDVRALPGAGLSCSWWGLCSHSAE